VIHDIPANKTAQVSCLQQMLSHRDTGVNMQALDFFRRNRNLAKTVVLFHYRDLEIIA